MIELDTWAQACGVDYVAWTALPAKFDGNDRTPTTDEVVGYLRGLVGPKRDNADLPLREEDLHRARHSLTHGPEVERIEMRAEREVSVDDLGGVVLAHLSHCFGQTVNNKPLVFREHVVRRLQDLPAGETEVQSVDERHVITDDVGQPSSAPAAYKARSERRDSH